MFLMADKPKVKGMNIQPDGTAEFPTVDGITVRARFESPTKLWVEMVRDSDGLKLPPDSGNIGTVSFRDSLLSRADTLYNPNGKGKKKPNTIPNLPDALGEISSTLGIPDIAKLLKPEEGTTLVDQLVEMVEKAGYLFSNPEGEPHVALQIEGHTEVQEIKGTRFRRWVRAHFYATEKKRLEAQAQASAEALVASLGALSPEMADRMIPIKKPPVVREQTLSDALAQLEAKAHYERKIHEVYVRTAYQDRRVYVDLGDETWSAVEIGPEGWQIIDTPPVFFVRPKGMLELPRPEEGGSMEDFRRILTLSDNEEDEKAWALIAAFLLVGLRPDHPEFPILVLLGAQGSAKSTTSRMIRNLLDPNVVEDTGNPRGKEELHIDAECSWLLAYDNLSGIPPWLSDAMCRISTGSAFTKRTQYTNRDREIFKAAQPQVLNGIADVVSRGDIIDRGIMVTLPTLEEHREKSAVWADFFKARPKILGSMYSAAAAGLAGEARGEEVEILGHRMADFAKWVLRAEEALGLESGAIKGALGDSGDEGASTVLEAEVISYHVYTFARGFSEDAPWVGTSTELYNTLTERATQDGSRLPWDWPANGQKLSAKLGRMEPALKKHGVYWKRPTSRKKGRQYTLYYAKPEEGDATVREGDATDETRVPQENGLDKGDSAGGTQRDAGDATFSDITEIGEDETSQSTRERLQALSGLFNPPEDEDELDLIEDDEEVEEVDELEIRKERAYDAIGSDEELTNLFVSAHEKVSDVAQSSYIRELGQALAKHFDHPVAGEWIKVARELVKESERREG